VERVELQSGPAALGYSNVLVNGSRALQVGESYTVKNSTGRVVLSVRRSHSHSVSVLTSLASFQLDNSDGFINQAVAVLVPLAELRQRHVHGLLGQTHTAQSGMDGKADDYVVGDDLFDNSFIYNRFVGRE